MLGKPYHTIYHLIYLYERSPCTNNNNLKFRLFTEGSRYWWILSTSWTFSHRWTMYRRSTPFLKDLKTITRTRLPVTIILELTPMCILSLSKDDYVDIHTMSCEYKIMPLKTLSKGSTYICRDPPKFPITNIKFVL